MKPNEYADIAPNVLRVPLETPAAPVWRETWFWEQVVYVLLCLGPAMVASYLVLATKGPVTKRDMVLLVGMALGQFIAQKVRSAASRQAALVKRSSLTIPEIRCSPKIKRWAAIGQVLGAFMSTATAPTWWHIPSVFWAVFAYELWRSHREARKRTHVIGGF
jgi:hypothetical protein